MQRLESQRAAAETALRKAHWDGVRRWYVNGQGQAMVVIPNPAESGESSIDHSFAISSHEVTVAEFRRFRLDLGAKAVLDVEGARAVLVELNDTCHLRPEELLEVPGHWSPPE